MIMLRERMVHLLLCFNHLRMIKKIGEKAMNHRVDALQRRIQTYIPLDIVGAQRSSVNGTAVLLAPGTVPRS